VTLRHLYIHVPFCARRCVYCDFSIAVRANVPTDEYVTALAREFALRHARVGPLATAYFGGGTPSKLGADGMRRVLDVVRSRADFDMDAEVTMEANPEDVSSASVRAWRAAGINRMSLGVQSFDDRVLSWMHRTHDASTARRAIQIARDEGLSNISIDLIFAMPATVDRSWSRDLDEALSFELPHLSVYGLTVEPHTPLGRFVARHDVEESPEEDFAAQFTEAHDRLTSAGLEHYEVSNFGRAGSHSRHNWAYWLRQPYAGLGPSAHEFDGTVRRWNTEAYAHWIAAVGADSSSIEGEETLGTSEVEAEQTYLGLRTCEGVVVSNSEREYVRPWIKSGWAELDSSGRLRLTPLGWLRLDSLAAALTALRSRS
jgi:putative oxygen-independent coproporphyrinogen III oxidase